MIKNWEIKKFSECLQKVSSTTKIPKKKFLSEGSYPIVSQEKSLVNGYWDNKDDLFIVDKPIVVFGDHTKVIKYVDFSFVRGADGVKILLPISQINSKFFSYQLQSIKLRDLGYARHFRLLKEKTIQIPPIEQQKEIAEILDQAFESIDKAKANIEKNIENAKELFQSKLNQMFSQVKEGWVSVSLKNIGIIQTGSTPSTKDKSNYGNHIPFVKPPHFNKNGTLNTGESMLSESGLKKSRLIKANSVLMVCIGATIGKTAFTEQDICTNQQINALTSNDNYIPKLLYYGMISPTFQNKVKSEGRSSQATLPIINKSKWSNLEIILPQNISKQKEIVETLDIMYNHIQSLLPSYEEELKNLEELKKSILRKAFSGELTNKNKAA